jgi:hypothetical protein
MPTVAAKHCPPEQHPGLGSRESTQLQSPAVARRLHYRQLMRQLMRTPPEVAASGARFAAAQAVDGCALGVAPALLGHSLSFGGCPNCVLGQRAWLLVGTDHFTFNLLVALAPWLLVLLASLVVEAAARRSALGKRPAPPPDQVSR